MAHIKINFSLLLWVLILLVATGVGIQVYFHEYGLDTFLLWLLLIVLICIPPFHRFFTSKIKHARPRPHLQQTYKVLLVVCVIVLCIIPSATALKFSNLLFFHGDEAIISRNAESAVSQALESGRWNFLGHEDGTISRFPALWYVLQGILIQFLGPSVAHVKVFSLITHVLLSLVQCYFVYKVFNKYLAIAWTIFFITFPPAIHFSLIGYQNLQSVFFAVGSVALAGLSLLQRKVEHTYVWLIVSGVAAGVGMYFYLSSILTPLYVIALLLISGLISRHNWKVILKQTAIFMISFLLVSLPFWIVAGTEYNFFAGRSSAFSSVIQQTTASSVTAVLIKQVELTVTAFINGPLNGDGVFYLYIPAFIHPILFFITLLGFFGIFILSKKVSSVQKTMLLTFLFIIFITLLFGSVLTVNPPAVQRILSIFPYLTFFTVFGVWILFEPLKKILSAKISNCLYLLCILAISLVQYNSFFTINIPQYISTGKNNPSMQYFVNNFLPFADDAQENVSTLITDIPIHLNDEIYYYSRGEIDPKPIFLDNFSHIERVTPQSYLLVDHPISTINNRLTQREIWRHGEFYFYSIEENNADTSNN